MSELKDLKLSALETAKDNQDRKYDIGKNRLETANKILKVGMAKSTIAELVNDTNNCKDFDEVWKVFIKDEYINDFESYIGFGIKEIEKIGRDKFLATVDWSIKNVHDLQWRKDLVKVVICNECKNEFTTFQLDYGICDECKKQFDMERFYESLQALEKSAPGSSSNEAMMFSFFEDYRNCYRILTDEQIIETVVSSNFVSPNAILLILESIKTNKGNVLTEIELALNNYISETPESRGWYKKLHNLIVAKNVEDIVKFYL